jgi:hypothetical protein
MVTRLAAFNAPPYRSTPVTRLAAFNAPTPPLRRGHPFGDYPRLW